MPRPPYMLTSITAVCLRGSSGVGSFGAGRVAAHQFVHVAQLRVQFRQLGPHPLIMAMDQQAKPDQ